MDTVEDLFHARTVGFAFHRRRLEFDLARTVFASATVDPGSALLLRHLQSLPLDDVDTVLDVGCGHGTLGIVLRALVPERRVRFVDRDALACRYTARNLAKNDLDDPEAVHITGGLGYDGLNATSSDHSPGTDGSAAGVDGPFDLVVSNIPGKVGESVIEHLVLGATTVTRPGALVGYVVVNPLADHLERLLVEPRFELVLAKGNKTHQVRIARVVEPATGVPAHGAFERGVYDRGGGRFTSGDLAWTARTVVGIDEFDELAQSTRLLRQALQGVRSSRSTVVNPGQGHRAVIAALAGYPPATLVSRDLLALRASERCLADMTVGAAAASQHHSPAADLPDDNEARAEEASRPPVRLLHQIATPPEVYDETPLTILHADDKVHGPWLTSEVVRYLDHVASGEGRGGAGEPPQLVLSGRSGLLGRLEADLLARRPGHVAYKKSVKGHRVLRFGPKVRAGGRGARSGQ